MAEHAETGAHPPAHGDGHGRGHVVAVSTYLLVFVALMVGTGLTVLASYADLGMWNTPVAMAIALTKASLVVFFFMHLKYSPKLSWVAVGAAVFWLVNMIAGIAADYVSRVYLNLGNPGT